MFGKGISREGDILDLSVTSNVVQKSGAWFAYNGDKIGQGKRECQDISVRASGYYGRNRTEGKGTLCC